MHMSHITKDLANSQHHENFGFDWISFLGGQRNNCVLEQLAEELHVFGFGFFLFVCGFGFCFVLMLLFWFCLFCLLLLCAGFFSNLKSSLIQASPRTSQAAVQLMLHALLSGSPP